MAAGIFPGDMAHAQVVMSGGTYSQNFDSLADSGRSGLDGQFHFAGLVYFKSGGSEMARSLVTRRHGFKRNRGDLQLWRAGSTERALGSMASGTPGNFAYGVRFTNDTGSAQSNFTVSYTGEQWRNGGNTSAQKLAFSFGQQQSDHKLGRCKREQLDAFASLDFTTPPPAPRPARSMATIRPTSRCSQTWFCRSSSSAGMGNFFAVV